jgi:hypothetical protein
LALGGPGRRAVGPRSPLKSGRSSAGWRKRMPVRVLPKSTENF